MERDANDNVRHELDDQFAALRDLIYAPDPSSTGSNSVPLGVREPAAKPVPSTDPVVEKLLSGGGEYDQHVRELAFDKRAKPKDRTKTEEELALEAKEALEKAEKRRRKRMLGLPESEDEDESEKGKGKRKRGADDLDDDFDEDLGEYEGLGVGLQQTTGSLTGEGSDDDSEDEESSQDRSEDEDEVQSEGEVSDSDDEEEDSEVEGEHELLAGPSTMPRSKSKGKQAVKQELPFTFPCPGSHEEFLEIVDDVDDEDVSTVVQRIRALYHTSLAADNKFKLQV